MEPRDRGEKGIEILSMAQNRNTTPANSLVVRVVAVSTMCARDTSAAVTRVNIYTHACTCKRHSVDNSVRKMSVGKNPSPTRMT